MKKEYGYLITAGAVCGALLSVWKLGAEAQPILASEPPPWIGKATVAQLAQNFQALTSQVQKLSETVTSGQITALLKERAEAQDAINEAAKNGRRDPLAELVRDRANTELAKILGQAPP